MLACHCLASFLCSYTVQNALPREWRHPQWAAHLMSIHVIELIPTGTLRNHLLVDLDFVKLTTQPSNLVCFFLFMFLQNVQVLQLAYLLGNFSTSLQICHKGQITAGIIHVFIPIDLTSSSTAWEFTYHCLTFSVFKFYVYYGNKISMYFVFFWCHVSCLLFYAVLTLSCWYRPS